MVQQRQGTCREGTHKAAGAAFIGALLVGSMLVSPALAADSKPDTSQETQIHELRALIEQQRQRLEELQAQVEEASRKADKAEETARATQQRAPSVQQATYRVPPPPRNGNYSPTADEGTEAAPADGTAAEGSGANQGSDKPPEVAALSDRGGVLLNRGQMVLEPSINYVRSDVNRAEIAGFSVLPGIVVGNIDVSEANRDTIVSAITARYGVTNRFEVEAKVPFVYRTDSTTTRPLGGSASDDVTLSADGSGLGDIELAGHYQINDGLGGWPFLVGNLRVKTRTGEDPFEVPRDSDGRELELPTGTGFWGVEPSLTVIYPSDPAVLYGNISYLWNIERDVSGFGEIDPGDAIGVNFGMGVALNEDISFSLGYDHKRVAETTVNGSSEGSDVLQVGRLLVGGSFRLSDYTSLNVTVGAGVTEDAPDLDLLVRVPVRFQVFN